MTLLALMHVRPSFLITWPQVRTYSQSFKIVLSLKRHRPPPTPRTKGLKSLVGDLVIFWHDEVRERVRSFSLMKKFHLK